MLLKKKNRLNEDLVPPVKDTPLYKMDIENGTLMHVSTTYTFVLEIPEGVTTLIEGSVDTSLFCSYGGYYIHQINKVVFPSTLENLSERYFFYYAPQYDMELEFKGDIIPVVKSFLTGEDNYWTPRFNEAKTPEKKKEVIERFICSRLNVYYSKTTFIYDVPLDLEALNIWTSIGGSHEN